MRVPRDFASESSVGHRVVQGSVYYALPAKEPLFWRQYSPAPDELETNIEFVEHVVTIQDARRSKRLFRLEVEGAAIHRGKSNVRDFDDEAELCRVGYAEAADIARAVSGAAHAVVFDHNIRRGSSASNQSAAQKPVLHVHTDFSSDSAPIRMRAFAASSDSLVTKTVLKSAIDSGRRFAVINVWRPIAGPVRDSPLALCDASSIDKLDLLPASLLYPERTGEIHYLKSNPAHRWWYLSDMQPDEAWVFKNYDSATDGRARFTAHTAFTDTTYESPQPRESVEFRTFVIFD